MDVSASHDATAADVDDMSIFLGGDLGAGRMTRVPAQFNPGAVPDLPRLSAG